MAESIIFVLNNLLRLLAREAERLCDMRDKVASLENELSIIKPFLESYQQNPRKSPIDQVIVRQFRGIAYDAEETIETFAVHAGKYQRRNRLSRILHGANYIKLLRHVAKKIDNINARLKDLHVRRIRYKNPEAAGSLTDQKHERSREVEKNDVVGFEHNTTEVINRLKKGGSSRDVVSIIGMGGSGKTTLANKIYNSDDVKNYFQCRAWVSVSNDYGPRVLLPALLKSLTSISVDFSCLSEEELKDKVKESLKGKRYFIVLDDMWSPQHWVGLQNAFPDENKSSRILITSRLKEVASRASRSPPYYLPLLNEEQSWELFSKKMFRGEDVPSDLKLEGEHMVKSCRGLPISIVVLAEEILANKEKSYREWSKIKDHVNSYLTRSKTRVHDIVIKPSYDSLRPRLKLCFLYFGMFPEDDEIPVRRLIHLWVAEGFVDLDHDSRTAEDVAGGYLDELIDHSLIQVGRRRSNGAIKTCHIHDLLREFCIYESKKENVFEVWRDANINSEKTKQHRLSIQSMCDFFNSNKDISATRSVLCFDHKLCNDLDSRMSKTKRLVGQIKHVRVLDLILPISTKHKIPTNLNMLVLLKYLRLDLESYFVGGFHKVIPEFICNLRNLETFDLRCSYPSLYIPFYPGIWKLKKLRHLYTAQPMILPNLSSKSESTWNLETLSCVAIKKKSVIVSLIEKGVFQKLRTLGLRCYKKKDGKHKEKAGQVWEILPKLNDLNALKIDGFPEIPASVSDFPSNLAELTISQIKLNDDVMSTLGNLTNLRILKLHRCYFTERLRRLCSINGFPCLEAFQLKGMSNLYDWELGENVMPNLRRLTIKDCKMLTALPNELWSLTHLREVQVDEPSSESVKMQLRRQPMRDGCNLIIS